MKLKFIQEIQTISEKVRILPRFESWLQFKSVHPANWFIPEFIHPSWQNFDFTSLDGENRFFNSKKKKQQIENRIGIKTMLFKQEDDVPATTHSVQSDDDKVSFLREMIIPAKHILLTKTKYSIPEQRVNQGIKRKWKKTYLRKKDAVNISLGKMVEEEGMRSPALPVLIRDKNIVSGATFRFYKKSHDFPFVTISAGSLDKHSNNFNQTRKVFPAVEFTYKPDFFRGLPESKQMIRDPRNPHKYTIRESMIPSLSKLTNQTSLKVDSPAGKVKFGFPKHEEPEYIHYQHIFHPASSDPLSNLIKYNFFHSFADHRHLAHGQHIGSVDFRNHQ